MQPKDTVYVGRRGKGKDGRFGNPVVINRECPLCGTIHADAASTLKCFKRLLWARIQAEPSLIKDLAELKGKKLWCPGCGLESPTCHARILERAAEWAAKQV